MKSSNKPPLDGPHGKRSVHGKDGALKRSKVHKPKKPAGAAATTRATPVSIDEYIVAFPPEVQTILRRIRSTIHRAAPDAQEKISYRMPAFMLGGVLVYFAAFKEHIGLYPPVKGDAGIEKAVSPYAGPKGNLRFPLDRPMPYGLIARIVRLRVKQKAAKTPGKGMNEGRPGKKKAANVIATRVRGR
jgi:uncharacterized protein YdhG (YjbR/CyaY superfamily)